MPAPSLAPAPLRRLFDRLLEVHGPQGWWPAATPFEVAAGAILVQATRWENADAALRALAAAGVEDPASVLRRPEGELERLLRPAGFFRQKARRLRSFARWLLEQGGFEGLADMDTPAVRARLLGLDGVGPETADCILVYALGRPVFVADAYARRLFARLGWWRPVAGDGYESLRAAVEAAAPPDARFFNELHALIVAHGKTTCRAKPACGACRLAAGCPSAPGTAAVEVTARRS